jgi:hypothetical protein
MAAIKPEGDYLFLTDPIGPDAVAAPVLAFGPIRPTGTGDRPGTIDPMTGFNCSNTPLGRGHIIALFLGGPDVEVNYAPQYEQWQQSGAWKRMESAMEAFAKSSSATVYMVVRLSYERTGNQYLTEAEHFASGRIVNWSDARIPNRFEVWRFLSTSPGADTFLAKVDKISTRQAALAGLTSQPFLTMVDDFDVQNMPDEDYRAWRKNLIRKWSAERVQRAMDDYDDGLLRGEALKVGEKTAAEKMPKAKTGGKIIKAPRRYGTSPLPRLSRQELTEIAAAVQARLGFTNGTSSNAWKLANIHRIVAYIRIQLTTVAGHGIRDDEVTILNGGGAGGFVTGNLM